MDTMSKLFSAAAHRYSRLRKDRRSRDPVGLAVLWIAAIAALAFVGSMIAVLFMHAP